jgi:hypothetical protein
MSGLLADDPEQQRAMAAFQAELRRRAAVEFASREANVRAALTAKVSAAMEAADEQDRLVDWDCMADETVVDWDALAEAAVGVFVELLRDPPTVEHRADGTEVVRWPGDEVVR